MPRRKLIPYEPKLCPACIKLIFLSDNRSLFELDGTMYTFHSDCLNPYLGRFGRGGKVREIIRDFLAEGYTARIPLETIDLPPPKDHVKTFEPKGEKKQDDLTNIMETLALYDKPLTRKEIWVTSKVPYSTVCWRIWEHLRGNDAGKEELFKISEDKGFRGVELIELI